MIQAYSWPFLEKAGGGKVPLLREARTRGPRQILIGSLGDPYASDASCVLTRGVLEAWSREWGKSIWLITRSSRVERDLHLLRALSSRHQLLVSVMFSTLDRTLAEQLEPGCCAPRERLQALSRLSRAGIGTGGLLVPILPRVNDTFPVLEGLMGSLVEAGISHLKVAAVRLRNAEKREACLSFLERLGPVQGEAARTRFMGGAEPSLDYQRMVATRIRVLRQKFGLATDDSHPRRLLQLSLLRGGPVAA